ncbi:Cell morphogenesis N-terminal [Popillia japonica]|uniref:Cell morphogenesis N-terminal n=1 Tax=Popillia japonica TaxID=7064 RepID=A0AAW1LZA0_POPJA
MITGERKPRIDLFRTCVAAVPRLIPDGMTGAELVDLLSRLTVHMDEELRGLAFQSLQTLVMDFPDWRQDVLWGFTQFLARDVLDTSPQLIDSGLRMLLQLLTTWKVSISAVSNTNTNTMRIGKDVDTKPVLRDNAATYRTDNQKREPIPSVLHLVEAFALVMFCNYRLSNRRLSVHILKDVKTLTKMLNCSEDQAAIDVMDQCCPQVVEKCIPFLPATEKAAIQAVSNIDLQWLADRNACIWTAGLHEDGLSKTGSCFSLNFIDPWSICLFGFLERNRILTHCPTLVSHAWPIVFTRINALYPVIDPTPVNDNRASLLRSSAAVKKPVNERDIYIHVWKNYITFAFRVVPPVPSPIVRCASPDLSLSSLEGVVESKLSTSLENLVQAQGFVSTGRFTLPLAAIRKQHKRVRNQNKSGGTGVPTGPVRNRHDDRLAVEIGEASGTTLLEDSTRTAEDNGTILRTPIDPSTGNVVEAVAQPIPVAQKGKRRTKWTEEMNQYIIRCYLIITEMETNKKQYSQELHRMVSERFPELKQKTPQNIVDQRRSLMMNYRMQANVIENIQRDVREILGWAPIHQEHETQQNADTHETQPNEHEFEEEHEAENALKKYFYMYQCTDPTTRVQLPKIRVNRQVVITTERVNEAIKHELSERENMTIQELQTIVYAGAAAVIELTGYKITRHSENKHAPDMKPNKPRWHTRLENKIKDLRKQIGRLTHIHDQHINRKTQREIDKIIANHKNDIDKTPEEILDRLKQKLAATAKRMARYIKSKNRKDDNNLFRIKQKELYRHLAHTNIRAPNNGKYPQEEQVKNFWKSICSSPDSLSAERNDAKMPGANVSPNALYKLVIPLLRCEVSDVRDAAVLAIGNVNSEALKDVMEELVLYIRDAVDKKQENVRRRRRRDALRLQLVKVLELVAEYGTFGVSSFVLDRDTNSLHPTFLEYMDGARLYLESELDKHTNSVKEITLHFCSFITKMIKSFSLETCQTLLKRDLRKNLFLLFATWSGKYGVPFAPITSPDSDQSHKKCTELQFSALQAMSALLCCGPCIDPEGLEYNEGDFYQWLDNMLNSHEEKVAQNIHHYYRPYFWCT